MHIKKAIFNHFRNLNTTLSLGPHFNVFTGSNGQGKTNILEGIHVAAYGRSFRAGRLVDLVQFDKESARVELQVDNKGVSTPVSVQLSKGSRTHTVGGAENASLAEVGERLRVIFFGPDDLRLVKGSPRLRRDFLDRAITIHYLPYARLLKGYQRLLRQRNLLLRDFQGRPNPPVTLMETYEEQLARHAAQIIRFRLKYLREFIPKACDLVQQHTDSHLTLSIAYAASGSLQPDESTASDALQKLLTALYRKTRAQDACGSTTSVGPHLDDLELTLNGKNARYFASQGEQRQLAVAFKLAQLSLWKERFGVKPVLLLDDVTSELDSRRTGLLFSLVSRWQVQTLISTTSPPDVLLEAEDCRFFDVREGVVQRRPKGDNQKGV